MSNPESVSDELSRIDAVAGRLALLGPAPRCAVVLGSGLGALIPFLEEHTCKPREHFGLPATGVPGHAGTIGIGKLAGQNVAIVAGRLHLYEGHSPRELALTPRVLAKWGVKTLLLTSAVGGIRPDLKPGQLVRIKDHLNLSGANPLSGPNIPVGTRFPDLSPLYSARLRALWPDLAEGVYAAMPGPSYETPAEIRMLGVLGADVVGMSMVHEAIAGFHAGLEVGCLAVVSNLAAGLSKTPLTHEEVTENTLLAVQDLKDRLITLVTSVNP